MEKVKKLYQEAFQKHGNSLISLFYLKGRSKQRFDSATKFVKDGDSVLDFGCGLGHLYEYLNKKYKDIEYTGCDFVEEFVQQSKTNYGDRFFHVNTPKDLTKKYDHIIALGVFNLLYHDTEAEQFEIIKQSLASLFQQTDKVLSVDFQTDHVDYKLESGYFQNVVQLYNYLINNLSRRIVLDQSHFPYEFTVHIFKDAEIIRPINIFRPFNDEPDEKDFTKL